MYCTVYIFSYTALSDLIRMAFLFGFRFKKRQCRPCRCEHDACGKHCSHVSLCHRNKQEKQHHSHYSFHKPPVAACTCRNDKNIHHDYPYHFYTHPHIFLFRGCMYDNTTSWIWGVIFWTASFLSICTDKNVCFDINSTNPKDPAAKAAGSFREVRSIIWRKNYEWGMRKLCIFPCHFTFAALWKLRAQRDEMKRRMKENYWAMPRKDCA